MSDNDALERKRLKKTPQTKDAVMINLSESCSQILLHGLLIKANIYGKRS